MYVTQGPSFDLGKDDGEYVTVAEATIKRRIMRESMCPHMFMPEKLSEINIDQQWKGQILATCRKHNYHSS